MTTLGSSVQTLGNLLHTHDLYDHLRAVPPAIAPYADPLNFCSPRIAARKRHPRIDEALYRQIQLAAEESRHAADQERDHHVQRGRGQAEAPAAVLTTVRQ